MIFGFQQPKFFEAQHHSVFAGIPILEQAQDWFEGLWNWVSTAANNAASWLEGRIGDILGHWNPETMRIESGLFGWIWDALASIGQSVGSWVSGAWSALAGSFDWLGNAIWGWFDGALRWLTDSFNWIGTQITTTADWIVTSIEKGAAGAWEAITKAADGIASQLEGLADSIAGSIEAGANETVAGVLNGLQGVAQGIWTYITTEIPKVLTAAGSWISDNVITPILGGLSWIFERITDAVTGLINSIVNLFSAHSPLEPEDALPIGVMAVVSAVTAGGLVTGLLDVAGTKILGSGFDLKGISHFITSVIDPGMFMGAVVGVLVGVGIRSPLTQFYRRLFRPEIPDVGTATKMLLRFQISEDQYRDIVARWGFADPFAAAFQELGKEIPQRQDLTSFLWRGLITENEYRENLLKQGVRPEDVDRHLDLTRVIPGSGDLIRMVVREAFDPAVVVKAPEIFAQYLTKTGLSAEWADRYWTAHFEPIALNQAYQNYWRGYWTEDQLRRMLVIADIHPLWHDSIIAVAYRPPSAREMGYGFDTGEYTVEDIERYRRWAGLSPEDAARAARAMVAYRTEAERNALRTEAMNDFVAGLDSEGTLRSRLASVGTRPDVSDLWVARAVFRAERDLTLDLVKASTTEFLKDLITQSEYIATLTSLGVVSERLDVIVADALARKRKAAKVTAIEKKRLVPEGKLSTALELGLLSPDAYKSRLVEIDYTPEDAQLLLNIATTALPLTAEERERRVKVIETKRARLNRRYDLLIQRLDQQLTLISDELEAAAATQAEVLEVFQTDLTFLSDELAAAPPAKVPALNRRIALIKERSEVSVAKYNARETRLRDNLNAAADRKQEILDQRAEELAELEEEAKLVQGS